MAATPEWYYSKGNHRHGPVSFDELQALVKTGDLQEEHLVWTSGMSAWVSAGSMSGLGPFLPSGPPPLPNSHSTATSQSVGQAANDIYQSGLGFFNRLKETITTKNKPQSASLLPTPVKPTSSGSRTAVLVLTIIGSFLSFFVGGCTSFVADGLANTGDSINRFSDQMDRKFPTPGRRSERLNTQEVRQTGNSHLAMGFFEAIIGLVGGIMGYRHFGTPNPLRIGPLAMTKKSFAGGLILTAALMSITNTFTFISAGILNAVASALCLLSKSEKSSP